MEQLEADVSVVGAGFAGLTAARRLNQAGRALREPTGLIHWAGTETSTGSHGSFDGAIRSGIRAANEILASDQTHTRPAAVTF